MIGMNELLKLAIEGHGGLQRWEQISRFRAAASITGAIWALKGHPGGPLDRVVLEGETREQRMTITPFSGPGRYTTWEPHRQTVETTDGQLIAARSDPAASFVGTTRFSPWDEFQVAYFASEANWNYFVAPFLFARDDFVTSEVEPWHEDGQSWRALLVTYPDTVVAHTRRQTYYFDDAGLLRRLDYSVDLLGGGPAVHYPSGYRDFDGIMVPTRRRVYVRNPDGSPVRDSVSVAVDVADVTFS
jgi:hypothetical protein